MNYGNLDGTRDEQIVVKVTKLARECGEYWRRLRWVYCILGVVAILVATGFFFTPTRTFPAGRYILWTVYMGCICGLGLVALCWCNVVHFRLQKLLGKIEALANELRTVGRINLILAAANWNSNMSRALREIGVREG
jgi:hypothetical protein